MCIDGLEGPSPIRRAVPLGESIPLYVGSTGKAILAFLPPAEIDRQLEAAAAAGVDVPTRAPSWRGARRTGSGPPSATGCPRWARSPRRCSTAGRRTARSASPGRRPAGTSGACAPRRRSDRRRRTRCRRCSRPAPGDGRVSRRTRRDPPAPRNPRSRSPAPAAPSAAGHRGPGGGGLDDRRPARLPRRRPGPADPRRSRRRPLGARARAVGLLHLPGAPVCPARPLRRPRRPAAQPPPRRRGDGARRGRHRRGHGLVRHARGGAARLRRRERHRAAHVERDDRRQHPRPAAGRGLRRQGGGQAGRDPPLRPGRARRHVRRLALGVVACAALALALLSPAARPAPRAPRRAGPSPGRRAGRPPVAGARHARRRGGLGSAVGTTVGTFLVETVTADGMSRACGGRAPRARERDVRGHPDRDRRARRPPVRRPSAPRRRAARGRRPRASCCSPRGRAPASCSAPCSPSAAAGAGRASSNFAVVRRNRERAATAAGVVLGGAAFGGGSGPLLFGLVASTVRRDRVAGLCGRSRSSARRWSSRAGRRLLRSNRL